MLCCSRFAEQGHHCTWIYCSCDVVVRAHTSISNYSDQREGGLQASTISSDDMKQVTTAVAYRSLAWAIATIADTPAKCIRGLKLTATFSSAKKWLEERSVFPLGHLGHVISSCLHASNQCSQSIALYALDRVPASGDNPQHPRILAVSCSQLPRPLFARRRCPLAILAK